MDSKDAIDNTVCHATGLEAEDYFYAWACVGNSAINASISCVLKRFPEDFEVREIPGVEPVDLQWFATERVSRIGARLPVAAAEPESEGSVVNTSSTEMHSPALSDFLSAAELIQLKSLNDSASATVTDNSVVLSLSLDKSQRAALYPLLKAEFPFIRMETVASDQNDSEDKLEDRPTTVIAVVDNSFLDLQRSGLSLDDIRLLYDFRNKGPSDGAATRGVRVGVGLSKEQRSAVYQQLRIKCTSLDSKTMDCRLSGEVVKVMLVHWTQKALRKRKSASVDNGSKEEIVRFVLLKYDVEQLTALHQVAALLGISPSDVAIAGTKDKRAVTYQVCSATFRDNETAEKRQKTRESESPFQDRVSTACERLGQWYDRHSAVLRKLSTSRNLRGESLFPFICCGNIERNSAPVRLGELWGNSFRITLRNLRAIAGSTQTQSICEISDDTVLCRDVFKHGANAVKTFGFANYYGTQRMGLLTNSGNKNTASGLPIGPLIGKLLLLGYHEAAVHCIMFDCLLREPSDVPLCCIDSKPNQFDESPVECYFALAGCSRSEGLLDLLGILKTVGADKQFVDKLSCSFNPSSNNQQTEKQSPRQLLAAIIKGLPSSATRPITIAKAMLRLNYGTVLLSSLELDGLCRLILQQIPYSGRSLWISAFQSWCWNRAVSARFRQYGNTLQAGDLIPVSEFSKIKAAGPILQSDQLRGIVRLTTDDIDQLSSEEALRIAQHVVMPLIGSNVILPMNESGRYYESILSGEGMALTDIGKWSFPVAGNSSCLHSLPNGSYRRIVQTVEDLEYDIVGDSDDSELNAILSFRLPAGSYATVLLREILRNNDVM